MSLQSVRQSLTQHASDIEIIELNQSTVTVNLAVKAHDVGSGQIAETPSLRVKNDTILVVAKGDARLDDRKPKSTFGVRTRMLSNDEVVNAAGHPVGGVCPLGLGTPISVYCDVSPKHCTEVLPTTGAIYSAAHITSERVVKLTSVTRVDVCR